MDLARPWIEPVAAAEFAALMERFAPFEPRPHIAAAVSGGRDSMALLLLADEWARGRGGRVTALTVDHGLRPAAASEAAQVAAWCASRGIAHAVLAWPGPRPATGIQAAARAARYRLLDQWCRAAGVLHLLVAHHAEDQVETVLMRLLRGSGPDGLAGMTALAEHGAARRLRPLLALSRARLTATLDAAGQGWVEDPSNRDPHYLRAQLRAAGADFAARGLDPSRLRLMAARFGRARNALETALAAFLARAVSLDPCGFAWIEPEALAAAPADLGIKALAAVLTTVSGADYPPRLEGVERLFARLSEGLAGGRSLAGCLIAPRRGRVLICREPAVVAAPTIVRPSTPTRWDGRFTFDFAGVAPSDFSLGALGPNLAFCRDNVSAALARVPPLARSTLPALRDREGILAVPGLGYRTARRPEFELYLAFRPTRPLTSGRFTIV